MDVHEGVLYENYEKLSSTLPYSNGAFHPSPTVRPEPDSPTATVHPLAGHDGRAALPMPSVEPRIMPIISPAEDDIWSFDANSLRIEDPSLRPRSIAAGAKRGPMTLLPASLGASAGYDVLRGFAAGTKALYTLGGSMSWREARVDATYSMLISSWGRTLS